MKKLDKIYNLLERIDTQYHDYALLTESQESKSISAAKKLVMQKFGWNEQRADEFIRKELRHDFSVLHHNSKAGKFILGLTRMFCDNQLSDGGTIQQLNRTLELIASDTHINEYDRNLNGLSAQELIDRFAGARKDMTNKDREEVGALELQENNDYTIVQIDDFEQSRQYGQYTSWCVTHSSNMLDSYTSDGIGQFYFCLKNGFENVPQERGEGCPLDEYGLSMVAVSVDENGALNTCTCRWNHDNGGNDNIMDTKQISQLIGRNFYEVFKPNNKWQTTLDDAMQRLANGENPKDIFDRVTKFIPYTEEIGSDYYLITLCNKNNILKDKTILSDLWFDEIYISHDPFGNGSEPVLLNNKWNLIDINGKLLSSDLWFTAIGRFEGNFAIVVNERKYNFIDTNGNLLSPDLWFDDAARFFNGFARVSLNNRWNFIQTDGKLLYDDFKFKTLGNFHLGYASISTENGYNYINKEGELLSDMWFDECYDFNYNGMGFVDKDNLENIIFTNGKLLSPNLWFDDIIVYEDGMAMVELNRKYNFIKLEENGELLSDIWFDRFNYFKCGMARVQIIEDGKRKYNYIDKNGNLLFKDKWLYGATEFENGRAAIATFDGESYFINTNGDAIMPYF